MSWQCTIPIAVYCLHERLSNHITYHLARVTTQSKWFLDSVHFILIQRCSVCCLKAEAEGWNVEDLSLWTSKWTSHWHSCSNLDERWNCHFHLGWSVRILTVSYTGWRNDSPSSKSSWSSSSTGWSWWLGVLWWLVASMWFDGQLEDVIRRSTPLMLAEVTLGNRMSTRAPFWILSCCNGHQDYSIKLGLKAWQFSLTFSFRR